MAIFGENIFYILLSAVIISFLSLIFRVSRSDIIPELVNNSDLQKVNSAFGTLWGLASRVPNLITAQN